MNGSLAWAIAELVLSVAGLVLLWRYVGYLLALAPMTVRWWLRRTRPGSEPTQEALTRLIEEVRRP